MTIWNHTAKLCAIEITKEQDRQLHDLMDAFLEENAKINLSAYRDEETCWVGNVLDSVSAFSIQQLAISGKVIEVGTGGGFPLLPLAILFPDAEFTGLDATRKKIDAVQRIIDKLQLPNVRLTLGRAEELGHDYTLREQFDVVLSRAVAPLATLLEFMSPFASVSGKLLCWKSMSIEEELMQSAHAAKEMQCKLIGQEKYELPGDWGTRQILIYEKIADLSSEFPREVGIPKKEPL